MRSAHNTNLMNQTLDDECLWGANLKQNSTDLPLPLIVLLLGRKGSNRQWHPSTIVSITAMLSTSAYHPCNPVWEALLQHLHSYLCLVKAGKKKKKMRTQIISTVQLGTTAALPAICAPADFYSQSLMPQIILESTCNATGKEMFLHAYSLY